MRSCGRQSKAVDKSIKIGSSFETVYKGVPQGSILDPILFKIFINDIFYSVDFSTIYNVDKSIKIAAIYLFSSKAFFQSSIIFSKAV
jgi:hypothetical protein